MVEGFVFLLFFPLCVLLSASTHPILWRNLKLRRVLVWFAGFQMIERSFWVNWISAVHRVALRVVFVTTSIVNRPDGKGWKKPLMPNPYFQAVTSLMCAKGLLLKDIYSKHKTTESSHIKDFTLKNEKWKVDFDILRERFCFLLHFNDQCVFSWTHGSAGMHTDFLLINIVTTFLQSNSLSHFSTTVLDEVF